MVLYAENKEMTDGVFDLHSYSTPFLHVASISIPSMPLYVVMSHAYVVSMWCRPCGEDQAQCV